MSEKVLLSFVIPVYNVEKYLNECLDSIFDPSVSEDEYEVIAIDDGSTDGSPEILKTYTHHKNFRIITQENAGQGPARNAGIKAAAGKYISFVDSDDYLLPEAVPTLLGWARESDCDIVEFEIESHNETSLDLYEVKPRTDRISTCGTGKKLFVEWTRQNTFLFSPCIRIYRIDFINTNSLYFLPMIYEDAEWQPKCFFYADKVAYFPITLYHYRRRGDSTTVGTKRSDLCKAKVRLAYSAIDSAESIGSSDTNNDFIAALGSNIADVLWIEINFAFKYARMNVQDTSLSKLEIIDLWNVVIRFVLLFGNAIELNGQSGADNNFMIGFGNILARMLEHEINFVYKYVPKNERAPLISKIEEVRHVLRFNISPKGKRLYNMTRWLPAKIAFRMYKIF